MGNCSVTYREIRFVVEDELTQAYVKVEAGGDYPHFLPGWYHKTFPKSKMVEDILREMFTIDDCLKWSKKVPE